MDGGNWIDTMETADQYNCMSMEETDVKWLCFMMHYLIVFFCEEETNCNICNNVLSFLSIDWDIFS